METDKHKTNPSSKPNSEERASQNKEKLDEKWKADAKSFATNAGLTLLQGALFALGGIAARSAVDRAKNFGQSKLNTSSDNVVRMHRQSANA